MLVSFCLLCISFASLFFFFFNDTATTEIYTLSLHDALPICRLGRADVITRSVDCTGGAWLLTAAHFLRPPHSAPTAHGGVRLNDLGFANVVICGRGP